MSIENIEKLEKELNKYILSSDVLEPFVFLYGKEKKEVGVCKIKNLSISSEVSRLELIKILNSYQEKVSNYLKSGFDIKDLNNGDDTHLLYKGMDEADLNKTKQISAVTIEINQVIDFLKTNKFKNVFFIVEINLNASGDKKIILFKSVSQNYYVKKTRNFIVSLYDERQRIKFIKNKDNLILDENFEIAAYIDKSHSFFLITDRKKFEDLYEYHEKYMNAYDVLIKSLNFIEWGNAKATAAVQRSCYGIANFVRLDECVSKLKTELTSTNDNTIKKAIKAKQIKYDVKNGKLKIIPKNSSQLKALLKIITDGVAKTCLLDRDVIGSDFEELT